MTPMSCLTYLQTKFFKCDMCSTGVHLKYLFWGFLSFIIYVRSYSMVYKLWFLQNYYETLYDELNLFNKRAVSSVSMNLILK